MRVDVVAGDEGAVLAQPSDFIGAAELLGGVDEGEHATVVQADHGHLLGIGMRGEQVAGGGETDSGIALALEAHPLLIGDIRADVLDAGAHAARTPLVDDAGRSAFRRDHEVRVAVPLLLNQLAERLAAGNAGAEIVDADEVHAGIGDVVGDDRDIGLLQHGRDGQVGRGAGR